MKPFDAAVVGGGLAGLAASVRIAGGGGRVALLESSTKLGGRCYSYRDAVTGETVDNGQHVLIGSYRELLSYLGAIGSAHLLRADDSLTLPFHHPERGFATFRMGVLPAPLDITAGVLRYRLLSVRQKAGLLAAGRWLQACSPAKEAALRDLTVARWLEETGQDGHTRACFWDPISISVMNEEPERASALVFARAMRKAFLHRDADSRLLIPTAGQTELYVDGAVRLLESRGSVVRVRSAVSAVELRGGRACGVRLRDGSTVTAGTVIAALPPWSLATVLPRAGAAAGLAEAAGSCESSPIVSMNLWFDRDFMEGAVLGMIGTTVQWAFNRRAILREKGRGGCIACVVSAARDVVRRPAEELAGIAAGEVRALWPAGRGAKLVHSSVHKERRATFSPTPGEERRRPGPVTGIDGLLLAGDWTATGLPATIEGAVQSGHTAASLVLAR